jgi:hypothetical protein
MLRTSRLQVASCGAGLTSTRRHPWSGFRVCDALRAHLDHTAHRPASDDEAPGRRRVYCRRYDGCLGVAVANDWPGFACHACGAYEPLTDVEEARDARGRLELVDLIRGIRRN